MRITKIISKKSDIKVNDVNYLIDFSTESNNKYSSSNLMVIPILEHFNVMFDKNNFIGGIDSYLITENLNIKTTEDIFFLLKNSIYLDIIYSPKYSSSCYRFKYKKITSKEFVNLINVCVV